MRHPRFDLDSLEVRLSSGAGSGSPTVLHYRTHPDWYWTTTNASEAIPGVPTPVGRTLWGPCREKTMRRVFHTIGGLPSSVLQLRTDESVVTYLCHESCAVSGEVLRASGGDVAPVFVGITDGYRNPELTAEDVRDQLDVMLDTSAFSIPGSATVGLQVRS
jgi:hypothetical protein